MTDVKKTDAEKVQTLVDKMLSEHRSLVALYPVKTGADKAQVSRKINLLETLDMLPAGLRMRVTDPETDETRIVTIDGPVEGDEFDFDHFVIPTAYTRKWTLSESDLLTQVENLRKQATAEYLPDVMRDNAGKQLTLRLSEASKRGIKVPDGFVPVSE